MKLFTTVLMAGQAAAEIFECKHPQSTTWDDGNVLGQITGLETDPLTCAVIIWKKITAVATVGRVMVLRQVPIYIGQIIVTMECIPETASNVAVNSPYRSVWYQQ